MIWFFLLSGLFLGWSLGANDAANVFGTAEEVIDYVSKNEGGIGFIPETKAKALKNCKVIKLDSKATF